jgi:protein-disulfide isomerase
LLCITLFGVAILIGKLGMRPLSDSTNLREFDVALGRTLPLYFEAAHLSRMRPCGYNSVAPDINPDDWIDETRKIAGFEGKLNLIVFLDPNCPHCATYLKDLVKGDHALRSLCSAYIIPRALSEISLPQIEALEIARSEGKYSEMWIAQFLYMRPGGFSESDIKNAYKRLKISLEDLDTRVARARLKVEAEQAKAVQSQIMRTPSVYLDGKLVDSRSQDVECLMKLIAASKRQ